MTNGFVTRKVARLTKEREEAKARAAALDKAVLRLLGREEVVVAKIMSMPGIGISTKDIEELL